MNIFITKSYGKAGVFGVGSYIDMLIRTLGSNGACRLFIVHINTTHSTVSTEKHGTVTHIYIPGNTDIGKNDHGVELFIDELFARAIYTILSDYFDDGSPSIIHLNSLMELNIARVAKEHPSTHVVYSMHVLLWHIFYKKDLMQFRSAWLCSEVNMNKLALQFEREICFLADKVICLTEEAMSFTKEYYCISPAKVDLVYKCIDKDLLLATQQSEKGVLRIKYGFRNTPIIIFSGRLQFEKGLDYLIDALHELHEALIDFHLIICGEGDYGHYLHKCAGFAGKVSFTGFLNKGQLYDLYRLADIGVHASLSEQNSFSVLEMMALGLPVIVPDNDSFTHLKSQHPGAVFIPPANEHFIDVSILKTKLKELIHDRLACTVIGRNAGKIVAQRFAVEKIRSDMEDLYSSIL